MTLNEAQDILAPVARKIGLIYGAHISVDRRGDALVFIDDMEDVIVNPDTNGAEVCATEAEIADGSWITLFSNRAMLAALIQRVANHG